MLIDRGFSVENYVGTYRVEYSETIEAKMIVSEEFNCPIGNEKELKKKQIFSFDSADEFLFLELANLDVSNEKDVLTYCNKYGLPYSSQVCMDTEIGFDADVTKLAREVIGSIKIGSDNKYLRQDTMTYDEFCRLATHVRLLLEFKTVLDSTSQVISDESALKLLRFMIYFSLFSQEHIYDYSMDNPDPLPQTRTVRFQYSFHYFRRNTDYPNMKELPLEEQFFVFLRYCHGLTTHEKEIRDSAVICDLASSTISKLFRFYVMLFGCEKISENGWFSMIRNGAGTVPEDVLPSVDKMHLRKLCIEILSDIVNEGLRSIRPQLVLESKEGFEIEGQWKFHHQMEGIYMEFFIELAKNSQYRLCDNPTCGKLFSASRNRPNKRYCCRECALLQAKRNQRARERAKQSGQVEPDKEQ